MLIPIKDVIEKYALTIKGVVQIGSHFCEEHEDYLRLGINKFVYIEPCKEAFDISVKKLFNYIDYADGNDRILLKGRYMRKNGNIDYVNHNNIIMLRCACGEEEGDFDMYVSPDNQGQSNSLLKPLLHLQQHPEVKFTAYERVKVMRLDDLPFKRNDYNLLVLDTQGAEGMVLAGATETLKYIDCIYTEINTGATYDGNMLVGEMDEFLEPYGFVRVETKMPSANWTWGDSVFIKRK